MQEEAATCAAAQSAQQLKQSEQQAEDLRQEVQRVSADLEEARLQLGQALADGLALRSQAANLSKQAQQASLALLALLNLITPTLCTALHHVSHMQCRAHPAVMWCCVQVLDKTHAFTAPG